MIKPSLAMLAMLAVLLSGCAGTPAPPLQFYQLRIDAPRQAPAAAPVAEGVWQLLLPVALPDYLDRDQLWLPVGQAGLQALEGQRWAEPLREALPRILGHDLALLRGQARVWVGSPPGGLVIDRQLRVELLALAANAERSAVELHARWSLVDPSGRLPVQVLEARLRAPSAGPAPDQLVAAHRLALWMLAQQLAAS